MIQMFQPKHPLLKDTEGFVRGHVDHFLRANGGE
jgi:hypothetical protein